MWWSKLGLRMQQVGAETGLSEALTPYHFIFMRVKYSFHELVVAGLQLGFIEAAPWRVVCHGNTIMRACASSTEHLHSTCTVLRMRTSMALPATAGTQNPQNTLV